MNVLECTFSMLSVLCDGCAGAVSVLYYCLSFIILYMHIIITYREITILTGVLVIDLAVKCTIQPPLSPGRLKEGR